MTDMYLGALSGTSIDAADVIAADFKDNQIAVLAFASYPIKPQLAQEVRAAQGGMQTLKQFAQLDYLFAQTFADSINAFVKDRGLPSDEIKALGLHGQTVLHNPADAYPSTIQIGNPNIVAAETNLVTIADFRRADMAYGGQGAPLTPSFHELAFGEPGHAKAVVNIGGIANITVLSEQGRVTAGFDVGPGNCLMDLWARRHLRKAFDDGGQWAASAQADRTLLKRLSDEPYFSLPPPKSACAGQFDLGWLQQRLADKYEPASVQATLSELSAQCIAQAIRDYAPDTRTILICGGGAYNRRLIDNIGKHTDMETKTTLDEGINPMHVEALTFAWLAQRRLDAKPGAMTTATGARKAAILGAIYAPAR